MVFSLIVETVGLENDLSASTCIQLASSRSRVTS